jgi:N-acyl-D-amino-acid deacylase
MARWRVLMSICFLAACVSASLGPGGLIAAEPLFDVVIQHGRIVDGSGAPWYVADVGVRGGKIARIGRLDAAEGQRTIDATGLVVAPGFIDMMGQTATPLLRDPASCLNLLTQGITTINAGEGASAAPQGDDEARRSGWRTMGEYFALIDKQGIPLNVAQTVGHTQVRRLVLGDHDRRPSEDEQQRMCDLVEEAMQAGAIGVSTALIYPPAVFAQTDEIARLAEVAGRHGGRYYTHMRNEGDRLEEAIDEALEIGRRGKAPVHIFHLKAAGKQNWGKMQLALAKIKAARAAGEQVTADIYPYINNGLGIAALIHPRHFAAGQERFLAGLDDAALRSEIRREMETTAGWENWFRHVGHDWNKIVIGQTSDRRYADLAGQSVAEMARQRGEEEWDTFFSLVRSGAAAMPESMSEANKLEALREEFISFCTDVGPIARPQVASHPRAFGAFPRLLSRYVRELGGMSLERAVAQASANGANAIMAHDRGRIAEGLAADVIVFDYDKLADRATFARPSELSVGMKYVLVNGKLVLDDGRFTGQQPGRVLRGPGWRRQ